MIQRYPRIRIHSEDGTLLVREGLSISFFMHYTHAEIAQGVLKALEHYRSAVGPEGLGLYADDEGGWWTLDAEGWDAVRHQLHHPHRASVHLVGTSAEQRRYRFDYDGKRLGAPALAREPGAVSAVAFWLPTEYLEAQGPEQVRALAMTLAAPLPLCSGHAGLAFNGALDRASVKQELHPWRFRYPGLDILDLDRHSWNLGTRVRTVSWLTFLGAPVLEELGGAAALRSLLSWPDTQVEAMEGGRAVVTLGAAPEAGDTEAGELLPGYRELAHVLEPWLYQEPFQPGSGFTEDELRRWERRFLD
ncbi:Protein of unknown function [Stigmatella aurantiaca]|uniref:DUF3396 domain-containing protein n=1 Tax=Stigmatella aurantiaca TaxID=41 RepID=A0A1H8AVN7_STIAU|nr:DUF3396 domain-containing protein [Stigmatella aurantiaca]SEM74536.1 Protein of unknown function [Stigmatella aurantiaca]